MVNMRPSIKYYDNSGSEKLWMLGSLYTIKLASNNKRHLNETFAVN